MTRKLTHSTSVLRGIAPIIAVLIVLIVLAALAKTRAADQVSGKQRVMPVQDAASTPPPPVSVKPAVLYNSGGSSSYSVAIGDLNGDGKPDLVVANWGGNNGGAGEGTVGVLLGNGNGIFQTAVTYGSGGIEAFSVAIGDLNGDSKSDLVVTACARAVCDGGGIVGVLLGNGDGTFKTAIAYGSGQPVLGSIPTGVVIADVNGDHKPDLLVANSNALGGVLLGNGDGTFQPAMTYGANTIAIAVGDVNGDGKPDLVVANGGAGVLLGNGDGTFQPVVTYGSGGSSASVAIADLNGDGKPDLVVANHVKGSANGSLGVLLGNGDGTFQAAVTYSALGRYTQAVNVAKVNADEIPDIIAVNMLSGTVAVLLGNGDGTFQPTATFRSKGVDPRSVAIADLNGDGKPDLVAANECANKYCANGTLGVLLNTRVATKTVLTTSGSPSHVGQPVTFTATVTPSHGTIPDGELVTFYDGPTAIGTGVMASSVATFTTSSLTAKTHYIKAIYAGNAIFKPSTGRVTQVVQP
jgi:hypothetical protein